MVKVKNPDQLNIFDPGDFLTPKRRQMLESGRPGLFRKHIPAAVEAAMSEYDRRTGVKQLRVRDLKAVKFCAALKALGVNIFRAAGMMPEEVFCEA